MPDTPRGRLFRRFLAEDQARTLLEIAADRARLADAQRRCDPAAELAIRTGIGFGLYITANEAEAVPMLDAALTLAAGLPIGRRKSKSCCIWPQPASTWANANGPNPCPPRRSIYRLPMALPRSSISSCIIGDGATPNRGGSTKRGIASSAPCPRGSDWAIRASSIRRAPHLPI